MNMQKEVSDYVGISKDDRYEGNEKTKQMQERNDTEERRGEKMGC